MIHSSFLTDDHLICHQTVDMMRELCEGKFILCVISLMSMGYFLLLINQV